MSRLQGGAGALSPVLARLPRLSPVMWIVAAVISVAAALLPGIWSLPGVVGITLLNRLTAAYGPRVGKHHAFPRPEDLANASVESLRGLGFSGRKPHLGKPAAGCKRRREDGDSTVPGTRESRLHPPWELYTVQSRIPKMAPALRRAVRSLAAALTEDTGILDRLEVAAGEAIANAIGHGRGPTFAVAMYGYRDEISVTVMNRDGHHKHWDFCKPMPKAQADRGRGLPIMREMMDEVDVTWQGRQVSVWMTIRLIAPC